MSANIEKTDKPGALTDEDWEDLTRLTRKVVATAYSPWHLAFHLGDDWRLTDNATTSWEGWIEDQHGAEIIDLAEYAVLDFEKAQEIALDIVYHHNSQLLRRAKEELRRFETEEDLSLDDVTREMARGEFKGQFISVLSGHTSFVATNSQPVNPVRQYEVDIREVHSHTIVVEATSAEDAKWKAYRHEGTFLDNTLQYSHTLPPDDLHDPIDVREIG